MLRAGWVVLGFSARPQRVTGRFDTRGYSSVHRYGWSRTPPHETGVRALIIYPGIDLDRTGIGRRGLLRHARSSKLVPADYLIRTVGGFLYSCYLRLRFGRSLILNRLRLRCRFPRHPVGCGDYYPSGPPALRFQGRRGEIQSQLYPLDLSVVTDRSPVHDLGPFCVPVPQYRSENHLRAPRFRPALGLFYRHICGDSLRVQVFWKRDICRR